MVEIKSESYLKCYLNATFFKLFFLLVSHCLLYLLSFCPSVCLSIYLRTLRVSRFKHENKLLFLFLKLFIRITIFTQTDGSTEPFASQLCFWLHFCPFVRLKEDNEQQTVVHSTLSLSFHLNTFVHSSV